MTFEELSWWILEKKYIYYVLDGNHKDRVLDSEYDKEEKEYRQMCKERGVEPVAADMAGFDKSRPSCMEVIGKFKK